jgi:hypothetical protein
MDPGSRKRRVGMIEYVVPTAGTGIGNSGRGCEAGSSSRHGCDALYQGTALAGPLKSARRGL